MPLSSPFRAYSSFPLRVRCFRFVKGCRACRKTGKRGAQDRERAMGRKFSAEKSVLSTLYRLYFLSTVRPSSTQKKKRASLSFPFPPHIPPISFCKSDLVERAPNTKGAWEEGGGMRGGKRRLRATPVVHGVTAWRGRGRGRESDRGEKEEAERDPGNGSQITHRIPPPIVYSSSDRHPTFPLSPLPQPTYQGGWGA